MAKGDFVADRDLFLDEQGNLVEANDPNKHTKLAGIGARVSDEDVEKYGLKKSAKAEAPAPDSAASDAADLESLTVADLKEKAKEMGLKGYSSLNKEDLIEAIKAGPQEEAEE